VEEEYIHSGLQPDVNTPIKHTTADSMAEVPVP